MINDETRQRQLLGQFLRAHRERLSPAAGGLQSAARRRRTPGLRREEAAELAGISTTWYAWVEQGRDVAMSPHALSRVAEALKLSRAERAYMFELAGRRDPHAPETPRADQAPAGLAAAVARLEEPAYGLDRLWNACCWNAAAERLFVGWLGGPEPNLIRWIMLDENARSLIEAWEDRVRRVLAEFRADFSKSLNDPQMRPLVDGLAAESPIFARWWDEQAVMSREGGLRRFNHPADGQIAFEQFTFTPAERPDFKLVMLVRTAADAP